MSIQDNNLAIYLQNFSVSYSDNTGIVPYSNVAILPTFNLLRRSWNITQQAILQKNIKIYRFEYDFSLIILPPEYSISFEGPLQGTVIIGDRKEEINLYKYMTYTYNFELRKLYFSFKIPCKLEEDTYVFFDMFINDAGTCNSYESSTCTTPQQPQAPYYNGETYTGTQTTSYCATVGYNDTNPITTTPYIQDITFTNATINNWNYSATDTACPNINVTLQNITVDNATLNDWQVQSQKTQQNATSTNCSLEFLSSTFTQGSQFLPNLLTSICTQPGTSSASILFTNTLFGENVNIVAPNNGFTWSSQASSPNSTANSILQFNGVSTFGGGNIIIGSNASTKPVLMTSQATNGGTAQSLLTFSTSNQSVTVQNIVLNAFQDQNPTSVAKSQLLFSGNSTTLLNLSVTLNNISVSTPPSGFISGTASIIFSYVNLLNAQFTNVNIPIQYNYITWNTIVPSNLSSFSNCTINFGQSFSNTSFDSCTFNTPCIFTNCTFVQCFFNFTIWTTTFTSCTFNTCTYGQSVFYGAIQDSTTSEYISSIANPVAPGLQGSSYGYSLNSFWKFTIPSAQWNDTTSTIQATYEFQNQYITSNSYQNHAPSMGTTNYGWTFEQEGSTGGAFQLVQGYTNGVVNTYSVAFQMSSEQPFATDYLSDSCSGASQSPCYNSNPQYFTLKPYILAYATFKNTSSAFTNTYLSTTTFSGVSPTLSSTQEQFLVLFPGFAQFVQLNNSIGNAFIISLSTSNFLNDILSWDAYEGRNLSWYPYSDAGANSYLWNLVDADNPDSTNPVSFNIPYNVSIQINSQISGQANDYLLVQGGSTTVQPETSSSTKPFSWQVIFTQYP